MRAVTLRSWCLQTLFLLSVVLLCQPDPHGAQNTTCAIQAVYLTEAAALLICKFTEDLNQTKKNFCVKHYFNNTHEDVVVECIWNPDNTTRDCFVKTKDGFSYNNVVSDTLTVVIRNASENHAGRFKCLVDCTESIGASDCLLELKTGGNQQSNKPEAVMIPVVVSLLLAVVLAVSVVLLIRHRRSSTQNNDNHTHTLNGTGAPLIP